MRKRLLALLLTLLLLLTLFPVSAYAYCKDFALTYTLPQAGDSTASFTVSSETSDVIVKQTVVQGSPTTFEGGKTYTCVADLIRPESSGTDNVFEYTDVSGKHYYEKTISVNGIAVKFADYCFATVDYTDGADWSSYSENSSSMMTVAGILSVAAHFSGI